jgi:hypothetical protein
MSGAEAGVVAAHHVVVRTLVVVAAVDKYRVLSPGADPTSVEPAVVG